MIKFLMISTLSRVCSFETVWNCLKLFLANNHSSLRTTRDSGGFSMRLFNCFFWYGPLQAKPKTPNMGYYNNKQFSLLLYREALRGVGWADCLIQTILNNHILGPFCESKNVLCYDDKSPLLMIVSNCLQLFTIVYDCLELFVFRIAKSFSGYKLELKVVNNV